LSVLVADAGVASVTGGERLTDSVRLSIPVALAGTAGASHLFVGPAGALVAAIGGRNCLSNTVFLVVESASSAVVVGAADLTTLLTGAKVAVSVELFADFDPSPIVSAALILSLDGWPVGSVNASVFGAFVIGLPNRSDGTNGPSLGLFAHQRRRLALASLAFDPAVGFARASASIIVFKRVTFLVLGSVMQTFGFTLSQTAVYGGLSALHHAFASTVGILGLGPFRAYSVSRPVNDAVAALLAANINN